MQKNDGIKNADLGRIGINKLALRDLVLLKPIIWPIIPQTLNLIIEKSLPQSYVSNMLIINGGL